MNNPFSAMNMMMGCCRERHLTRIDPNVGDENVSWVWTLQSGAWGSWESTPVNPAETLNSYPDGSFISVGDENVLPMPYWGAGVARFPDNPSIDPTPYYGYLTGPSKQSGRTSELYFRAVIFIDGVNLNCEVASVVGPDGKVIFSLTAQGLARNGWDVVAEWVTPSGESKRMRCATGSLPKKDWLDIKVFLKADAQASMSVVPVGQPPFSFSDVSDSDTGVRDNMGDRLHVFSAKGPVVAQGNKNLYIHRIGIGNKITTARP